MRILARPQPAGSGRASAAAAVVSLSRAPPAVGSLAPAARAERPAAARPGEGERPALSGEER